MLHTIEGLSDHQHLAVSAIKSWVRDRSRKRIFRLFGAAGTGKTTIIKHLCDDLNLKVCVATFTGKAAHVLTQKGVAATTIHSLIYVPVAPDQQELDALKGSVADIEKQLQRSPQARGSLVKQRQSLWAKIRDLLQPRFVLNDASSIADSDLVILDEVSMVGEELARDLMSFGKPILVVGDPHQLPPVDGSETGFFTSGWPDFELTEVHRQALDSPIIRIATDIRMGESYRAGSGNLNR